MGNFFKLILFLILSLDAEIQQLDLPRWVELVCLAMSALYGTVTPAYDTIDIK